MPGDEPPYLPVGTDVSAKYRGAFCEAKVKKIVRSVKCKVILKETHTALVVTDDYIKGPLKPGAAVEVRHPETNQVVEGLINRLTDSSMYTVVFDDGDERTLRRTQLCLKGEKHFIESETLDNLPLSHPEHFGTPVLQNKSRKRTSKMGSPGFGTLFLAQEDTESDDSSSEDCLPKRATYRGRQQELVGKVMCVDSGDKRKSSLIPFLIVLPDAHSTELKTKDHMLARSFRDGKFISVLKKELKDFTRDVAIKNEDKSLKSAMEKALLYYDSHELPNLWKKDELLGTDDEDDDDDGDSSDDEQSEERDRFVAQLYKFMDDRGTPINKGPSIGARDLNLYKLFRVVQNLGGYNRVTNQIKWRLVYSKMGLPQSNTASHQIKNAYKKYLHAFEDFYRKLGSTMGTISRPGRSRHNSGRSLLSFRGRDKDSAKSPRPGKSKEKFKDDSDKSKSKSDESRSEDNDDPDCNSTNKEESDTEPIRKERTALRRFLRDDLKETKSEKEKKEETKGKKEEKEETKGKKEEKEDAKGKKDEKDETKSKREEKKVNEEEERKSLRRDRHEERTEQKKEEPKPERETRQQKEKETKQEKEQKHEREKSRKKEKEEKEDKESDESKEVDEEEKESKPGKKRVTRRKSGRAEEIKKESEEKEDEDTEPLKGKKEKEDKKDKKETKVAKEEKKVTVKEKKAKEESKPVKVEVEVEGDSDSDNRETDVKEVEEDRDKEEYPMGTKLKVRYGRGRNLKLYEAKVVEANKYSKQFLVHYAGWNNRYDEWVRRDRIVGVLNKPDMSKKAKKMNSPKSPKQQSAAPVMKKRGRPPSVNQKSPGNDFRTPPSKSKSPAPGSQTKTRPTRSNSMEFPVIEGLPPKSHPRKTRRSSGFTESSDARSHEGSESSDSENDEEEQKIVVVVEQDKLDRDEESDIRESEHDTSIESEVAEEEEHDTSTEKDVETSREDDEDTEEGGIFEDSLACTEDMIEPEEDLDKALEEKKEILTLEKEEKTEKIIPLQEELTKDVNESPMKVVISEKKDVIAKPTADRKEVPIRHIVEKKEPVMRHPVEKREFVTNKVVDKIFTKQLVEKFVPKQVVEKSVQKQVLEKFVPRQVVEKFVPKQVVEKSISKFVVDKSVPKQLTEKSVPKQVAEKSVPKQVAEKPVPKQVAEKFVPKQVAEKSQKEIHLRGPVLEREELIPARIDPPLQMPVLKETNIDRLPFVIKDVMPEIKKIELYTPEPKKPETEVKEKKDKDMEKKERGRKKKDLKETKKSKQIEPLSSHQQPATSSAAPPLDPRMKAALDLYDFHSFEENDDLVFRKEKKVDLMPKRLAEEKDKKPEILSSGENEKKKVKKKVKKKMEEKEQGSEAKKETDAKKDNEFKLKKEPIKDTAEKKEIEGKKEKESTVKETVKPTKTAKGEKVTKQKEFKKSKETKQTEHVKSDSSEVVREKKEKRARSRSVSPEEYTAKVLKQEQVCSSPRPGTSANTVSEKSKEPIGLDSEEKPEQTVMNTVLDNTPPTTPEHEGAGEQLPSVHPDLTPEEDDHNFAGQATKLGSESPQACDANVMLNEGNDSSSIIPSSESSNDVEVSAVKRKHDACEHTPSKKKKRASSKVGKSSDRQKTKNLPGSDSDETNSFRLGSPDHAGPSGPSSPVKVMEPMRSHTPRPPKYDFNIEEGRYYEGERRITFLMEKMQEIRKIYMGLKGEVACIDRRRKRAKRKERENSQSSHVECDSS